MARRKIRWPKRGEWVVVEWEDACFWNVTGNPDVTTLHAPRIKLMKARSSGMVTDINRKTILLAHNVFEHGNKSHTCHEVMVVPRLYVTAIKLTR